MLNTCPSALYTYITLEWMLLNWTKYIEFKCMNIYIGKEWIPVYIPYSNFLTNWNSVEFALYIIPNSELCIYLQIKSQINGSACKQMGKIAKKADNHTYIYKIKCFHLVDKYMVITGRETGIQFAPVQFTWVFLRWETINLKPKYSIAQNISFKFNT